MVFKKLIEHSGLWWSFLGVQKGNKQWVFKPKPRPLCHTVYYSVYTLTVEIPRSDDFRLNPEKQILIKKITSNLTTLPSEVG